MKRLKIVPEGEASDEWREKREKQIPHFVQDDKLRVGPHPLGIQRFVRRRMKGKGLRRFVCVRMFTGCGKNGKELGGERGEAAEHARW